MKIITFTNSIYKDSEKVTDQDIKTVAKILNAKIINKEVQDEN